MRITPIGQPPSPQREVRSLSQATRVAIVAGGILGSAFILATTTSPGSLVLASIILCTSLAVGFNGENADLEASIYVPLTPSVPVHIRRIPETRPVELVPMFRAGDWRQERRPDLLERDDGRVPVGTGARNPLPYQNEGLPHIPVGRGTRNPPPSDVLSSSERVIVGRRDNERATTG